MVRQPLIQREDAFARRYIENGIRMLRCRSLKGEKKETN